MDAVLDKPLNLPVRDIRAAQIHDAIKPLMDEVGEKNHVRVVVHRVLPAGQGRLWKWNTGDLVHDNWTDPGGTTLALLPQLVMLDHLRALSGKKPVFIREAMRQTGGEFVSVTPNLRSTIGIDYVASALGDASGSRAAVAQYIALSNSTGTPTASDTTATTGASGTGINWGTANATDAAAANTRGEYTALGLARAIASFAHTNGTASYSLTHTYTASSAITAVQACMLSNSATQGQASSLTSALFVENTFTATSLATSDQITIAWTINI